MKTITICNAKGGSGKTTVTVLLAMAFREFSAGAVKVGIMDCDPQGSSSDWVRRTAMAGITEYPPGHIFPAGEEPDVLCVDTPGDLERLVAVIPPSDFYLLPVMGSINDWTATRRTIEVLTRINAAKVPLRVLFNGIKAGSSVSGELADIAASIQCKAFGNHLAHRVCYSTALLSPNAGGGWSALTSKAKKEVQSIAFEVMSATGEKKSTKRGKKSA